MEGVEGRSKSGKGDQIPQPVIMLQGIKNGINRVWLLASNSCVVA